jgi:putative membrane protein
MHFRHSLSAFAMVLALGVSMAACSDDDDGGGTTTDANATLNDNQVAAVIVAANTGEIQEGQVAQAQGSNDAVKVFAGKMVTEHTAANTRATALFSGLGITPQENATSQKLTSDASAMVTSLKAMSGAALDKAYIDGQVAAHQMVLDLIDKTLLPGASRAELKTELNTMRTAVAAHLAEAKTIQASLSGGGDGGTDGGGTDGGTDGGGTDGGGTDGGGTDGGGSDGGGTESGTEGGTGDAGAGG